MGDTTRSVAIRAFLLILCVVAGRISGNAQERAIILSPIVGDTIDAAERDRYQLFRGIRSYREGTVCQDSAGRLYAIIARGTPALPIPDTVVLLNERGVRHSVELIEHFNEIRDGQYRMGSHPGRPTYTDGTEIRMPDQLSSPEGRQPTDPPRPLRGDDLLPFARGLVPDEEELFPRFGCSVGMQWYSASLTSIMDMLHAIESNFSQKGYPVPRQTKEVDFPSSAIVFAADLRITPYLSLLFETASTSEETKSGWSLLGASAVVRIPPLNSTWLRPFVGLGVARSSVKISQLWDYSGTRVSPIDTSGSYQCLSSVWIKGSAVHTTMVLLGGIDFVPNFGEGARPISLSVMVRYLARPALNITSSFGQSASIDPGTVMTVARFTILL